MTEQRSKKDQLSRKERHDLKILALFTAVYCRDHHRGRVITPCTLPEDLADLQKYSCCEDCRDFLMYAIDRRLKCPLTEKPLCKHCTIHCYRKGHRERVREVMRYSGKALMKRGRLDLLWHYFF